MPENPMLTVCQVATILQLHPNTVRSMAERGELPATKIGNQWRFPEDEFRARTKPTNATVAA